LSSSVMTVFFQTVTAAYAVVWVSVVLRISFFILCFSLAVLHGVRRALFMGENLAPSMAQLKL
jgi:hypothetical protein